MMGMAKERYFKVLWFLGIASFLLALPNAGVAIYAVGKAPWAILMALALNGFVYGLALLPFVKSPNRITGAISCCLVLLIAVVPWLIAQGELAMHKAYFEKQAIVPQGVERADIKAVALVQRHRNPGCDEICRALLKTEKVRAVRMVSTKGNFGTTDSNEQLHYKSLPAGKTPPGYVFAPDLTVEVSFVPGEDLLEQDTVFNTLALKPAGVLKTTVWRGDAEDGDVLAKTMRYMYRKPMLPGLFFVNLGGLIKGGNDGGLIWQMTKGQATIAGGPGPVETLRQMGLRVP